MKSLYWAIISEATGETNPTRLSKIEEVMRGDIFHSTLDWQTRTQLKNAARKAVQMIVWLR